MKQFTDKQLKSLDDQIAALAWKLEKVCAKHQIAERNDSLHNNGWVDWDRMDTQEAIVNALQIIDVQLSNLSYNITQLANK